MVAGSECCPAASSAGSPGARKAMKKVMVQTAQIESKASPTRCIKKRAIVVF